MVDDSPLAPTLEVPLDTLVGEEKTLENIEMKKEKPKYPCTHCDNAFSSKNSRRRHLKRMHGNKNQQNEGPRESHQTQQAEPTSLDAEAEIVKENLRRVEKAAEMSCLSRPCHSTSRTVDISTAELKMEDLMVLDIIQLQDICVKWSLVSSGNRATLIDRLLNRSYHSTLLISKILNIDNESIFTNFFAVMVLQAKGHSKLIKEQIAQTQQQPLI